MEMWPCCVSVPTVNALQSCAPESFLELSKAEMFTSYFLSIHGDLGLQGPGDGMV